MAAPKRGLPAWNMLQCDGNMMALKRSLHSVVAHEGHMYVFGGASTQSADINIYNFEARRWETAPPRGEAPPCLWGHTAVLWGGRMVVFGGCGPDGRTSNAVHSFDLATREWRRVPVQGEALPLSRAGHSAVLVEDTPTMLVFAGEHLPTEPHLNDLWSLNLETSRWEQIPAEGLLPRGRKHHSAVEFEGKLYVFGGTDCRVTFNDFCVFDLQERTWTPHDGSGFPPTERFGHIAVVHNRRMHIFGGLETVQLYSTTQGLPVTCPFVPTPSGVINGPVVSQNLLKSNSIYFLNDWYKFSFRYGTWIRLTPNGHIPSGRWGHSALQFQGKLFILGGANHKGCLNDMYNISLSSLSNDVLLDLSAGKLVSCHTEPPMPNGPWQPSSEPSERKDKRQWEMLCEGEGGRGPKTERGGEGDGAMEMDPRDGPRPATLPPRRNLCVRRT